MMRIARLTTLLGILAALAAGSLAGASTAAVAAPTGLHGFLLFANESQTSVFHRTPSFAWKPVRGAVRHELQLSTSATSTPSTPRRSGSARCTGVCARGGWT